MELEEAIKKLNNKIEKFRDKDNSMTYRKEDLWDYLKFEDYKAIDIVLKVIDRLQEENEELKDYKERTEHTIMLAKATQRENEKLKEQLKAFTGIDIY